MVVIVGGENGVVGEEVVEGIIFLVVGENIVIFIILYD